MTSCAPSGATPPRRTNRSNTLHARCFLINRSFLASKCAWILCVSLGKWVHGDEACKQRALSLSLLWRWQYVLRSCSHFNPRYEHPSLGCAIWFCSGINIWNQHSEFLENEQSVPHVLLFEQACMPTVQHERSREFSNQSIKCSFFAQINPKFVKKSFILFWSWSILPPHFRVLTPPKIPLFSPVMRGGREGLQQGFRMWVFLGDKTGESIGIAWDNMPDKRRKRQTNERQSSSLGIDGFRTCFSAW